MGEFRRQRVDLARLPPTVVTKWSGKGVGLSVLDEGFVPLPKRLLRCMHQLFPGPHAAEELAAVLAVVDYKRPKLSRSPSMDYLAYLAGLPRERFAEVLDGLAARGLVERHDDDEGTNVEIDGLIRAIEEATAD